MAKLGLAALVLGLVGMLLGGGVLLVSLLLPALTDGRTSWDEALVGQSKENLHHQELVQSLGPSLLCVGRRVDRQSRRN